MNFKIVLLNKGAGDMCEYSEYRTLNYEKLLLLV